MPERPVTLLEKLNQVLENLALRLGSGTGTPPGGIPGVTHPTAGSQAPSFLDPIKRLLERMAAALEKALGRKSEGGSGEATPEGGSLTQRMSGASQLPPTGPHVPIWQMGTTPHGGPQGPSPGDEWHPIPDFQQALDEMAPRPATGGFPATGAAQPAAAGMDKAGFMQWLGAGGGAGTAAAGTGAAGAAAAAGGPIVMAAMEVKKKLEQMWKLGGKLGQTAADTARMEGPGDVVGGVFKGGEQIGETVGGPVGESITKVSSFGKTIAESMDNLRRFDREILNSTFRFSEFSSAMSAVEAQQEVRDIELGMRKGDAQAGSANKLAEAMSELNETVAPFENQFANFRNEVLAKMTQLTSDVIKTTGIIEILNFHLKGIAAILKVNLAKDEDMDALTDVTERLFKGGDRFARPDRFPE